MKSSFAKVSLIALALGLTVGLSLAADSKPSVADAANTKASANLAPTRSAPKVKLVDINNAKKEELKTLPGVTDEVAARVMAGRPYLSKAHLLTRKIIDASVYEEVKALVIAKQKQIPTPKPAAK